MEKEEETFNGAAKHTGKLVTKHPTDSPDKSIEHVSINKRNKMESM